MKVALAGVVAVVAAALAPAAARTGARPRWATVAEVPALPPPERGGSVTRDGARLFYAVFGPRGRSPVVLLHGGFASSASWGFEVPSLAAGHEVIVIDTRGHGRSTLGSAPLGYHQFAADTLAVMDRLGVGRAAIVGVSDGAITGLILAAEHPRRVAKLFAWGASFNTHPEPATPPDPALAGNGAIYMARMAAQYRAVSPTPDGFATLRTALARLYRVEPDLNAADLARIRAPTVIADGDHEQFIAPEHTAALARMIPRARLVILPDTSHGGPQQDPAAFHAAVAALLDPPR